jgi:hypothetical protein
MSSSPPPKWWPFQRKAASAVLMNTASPPRYESHTYSGHQLEIKSLAVGWQVIVTKDGGYVSNGDIKGDLATALEEAHEFIDKL